MTLEVYVTLNRSKKMAQERWDSGPFYLRAYAYPPKMQIIQSSPIYISPLRSRFGFYFLGLAHASLGLGLTLASWIPPEILHQADDYFFKEFQVSAIHVSSQWRRGFGFLAGSLAIASLYVAHLVSCR